MFDVAPEVLTAAAWILLGIGAAILIWVVTSEATDEPDYEEWEGD